MKTNTRAPSMIYQLIRAIPLGFFFLALILCFLMIFSKETIGWKIPVMGISSGILFLILEEWEGIALYFSTVFFPRSK